MGITVQGKRVGSLIAVAVSSLVLSACGDDDDFANEPRPPSPIAVAAVITAERVSIAPSRFGAGIVDVFVTNQTDATHRVTLRSAEGAPAVEQTTGPINPNDAASLRVDLRPGSYTLSAGEGPAIEPAEITVGARRPSAQDRLLQP